MKNFFGVVCRSGDNFKKDQGQLEKTYFRNTSVSNHFGSSLIACLLKSPTSILRYWGTKPNKYTAKKPDTQTATQPQSHTTTKPLRNTATQLRSHAALGHSSTQKHIHSHSAANHTATQPHSHTDTQAQRHTATLPN